MSPEMVATKRDGLGFRVQALGLPSTLHPTLSLLGLFGAFWGKVWALGARVWHPIMGVQEP